MYNISMPPRYILRFKNFDFIFIEEYVKIFPILYRFWIFKKIPSIKTRSKFRENSVLDKWFNNVLEQTQALYLKN